MVKATASMVKGTTKVMGNITLKTNQPTKVMDKAILVTPTRPTQEIMGAIVEVMVTTKAATEATGVTLKMIEEAMLATEEITTTEVMITNEVIMATIEETTEVTEEITTTEVMIMTEVMGTGVIMAGMEEVGALVLMGAPTMVTAYECSFTIFTLQG